jgi:hypothetical protein
VLSQHPDMIPALFTGLTDSRAIRGLTVLARAALTDPAAADQLDVALRSDLEHLVVPALAVAVETNIAVGDLIKNALSRPLCFLLTSWSASLLRFHTRPLLLPRRLSLFFSAWPMNR